MKRKFGWKRQLPDFRDKHFLSLHEMVKPHSLPPVVDMRAQCPAVYNQGQLGSCTANAIAFLCEFDWMKEKKADPFVPSRLFIYYNERAMEGTVDQDAGAMIRDGIKSLHDEGFCPENLWPYVEDQFAEKPSEDAFTIAMKEQVRDYGAVHQTQDDMKTALAAGYPFTVGISVYESFMSDEVARTGLVPMPKPRESLEGGHAVAIVGYNDHGWIMRNSWGESWGLDGYCILPYAYLTNAHLASDMWVVRMVP